MDGQIEQLDFGDEEDVFDFDEEQEDEPPSCEYDDEECESCQ